MSKLLLSCDEYIYEHNGRYYAQSQDWYEFYQRYLRVFEELRLVTRCKHENTLPTKRIPLDLDKRIEFIGLPFFQGPKEYAKVYFKIGSILKNIATGCDAAIIRLPWTIAPRIHNKIVKEGIPYACEVVFDAEDGWKGCSGISRLLWKRIDKEMRQMCAGAIGVSCVTEHYLQRHYFPTSKDAFTEHYSSLALDKSFFSSAKASPTHRPAIIVHTANQIEFGGRKGHEEIIKAVQLLKQRGVEVKARFAGKDYYGGVQKLSNLARELGVLDKVEFVGFLSREELDRFLTEGDIYVMPTRAEGLPRVIIEAMAKGLPCITTPVSGNPELVQEHFLVPYEDINMLAERIEELLSNPELYEEISSENFNNSWKYEAYVLEKRRDSFYGKLKDFAIKKN